MAKICEESIDTPATFNETLGKNLDKLSLIMIIYSTQHAYNSMYKSIYNSQEKKRTLSFSLDMLEKNFKFYITYGDDETSSEAKGSLTNVRIGMNVRRAFKTSLEENTGVASDDTEEEKYNKP